MCQSCAVLKHREIQRIQAREHWSDLSPPVDYKNPDRVIEVRSKQKPPLGQLTLHGAAQLRRLGKRIRRHYLETCNLIPTSLADCENSGAYLFVRSTNTTRTLQSAQNLLLGLYPVELRRDIIPVR